MEERLRDAAAFAVRCGEACTPALMEPLGQGRAGCRVSFPPTSSPRLAGAGQPQHTSTLAAAHRSASRHRINSTYTTVPRDPSAASTSQIRASTT